MKKRILSIMLVILLLLSSNVYANENEQLVIRTRAYAINLLKQMGYEQWEIDLMSEDELQEYQMVVETEIQKKYYRVEPINRENQGMSTVMNIDSHEENTYLKGVTELSKTQFENEIAKIDEETISPSASDAVTSSNGYLTSSITLSKLSSGDCKVTYIAKWVKKPYDTKKDVAVALTNAGTLKSSSPVFYYTYIRKTYSGGNLTKTESFKDETASTKMELERKTIGCALIRDLKDDTVTYSPTKNGKEFSEHKLYLSYKVAYEDKKQIAAEGHYYHQDSSVAITPSVSIGKEFSYGAGISVEPTSKMQAMRPNAYVDMTY